MDQFTTLAIGAAREYVCRRVVAGVVILLIAVFAPLDAALGAHRPDQRLELCAEALADDAVEDDIDGRVHDEEQVGGAQHHIKCHGHMEPRKIQDCIFSTCICI